MATQAAAIIKSFLLEGPGPSDRVRLSEQYLREILRSAVDLDIEFTPAELDALQANPHRLARLYELAAELHAPERQSLDLEQALETARGKEVREIDAALETLLTGLPTRLLDWRDWFGAAWSHRDFPLSNGLPHVRQAATPALLIDLCEYGVFPETIAGAMRGMELLFDERLPPDGGPQTEPPGASLPSAWIRVQGEAAEVRIPVDTVVAHVATTPYLQHPALAWPLTTWILEVAKHRPWFVRGYEFRPDRDAPIFRARPGRRNDELLALWSTGAPRYMRQKVFA